MTEGAAPTPRRRARWWLLGALACILLLALAMPWLLSTGFGQARIQRALGEHLATPVDFDSLSLSWWSGLDLKGLRVADPDPGVEPAAEVERIRLDLSFLALLTGTVKADVQVDSPVVRVRQGASGSTNWDRILAAGAERAPPQPDDAPRQRPREPGTWSPGEDLAAELFQSWPELRLGFALRKGRVEVRDGGGQLVEALTDLEVTAENSGPDPIFEARLQATLERGSSERSPVELVARINPQVPQVEVKFAAQGLSLAPYRPFLVALGVDLTRLEGRVAGALHSEWKDGGIEVGGNLNLDGMDVEGPAIGGRISVPQGRIRPELTVGLLDGRVQLDRVELDLGFLKARGLSSADARGLLGDDASLSLAGLDVDISLAKAVQATDLLPPELASLEGRLVLRLAVGAPRAEDGSIGGPLRFALHGDGNGLAVGGDFLPEGFSLPRHFGLDAEGSFDADSLSLDAPSTSVRLGQNTLTAQVKLLRMEELSVEGQVELDADFSRQLARTYGHESLSSDGATSLAFQIQSGLPLQWSEGSLLPERLSTRTTLQAPTLRFHELELSQLGFEVEQQGAGIQLRMPSSALLNGGAFALLGSYEATDTRGRPFSLELEWKNGLAGGSLTPLLRYAVPFLAGLEQDRLDQYANLDFRSGVDLTLSIQGPSHRQGDQSWLDVLAGWVGGGSLELSEGHLAPAETLQQLALLLDGNTGLRFSRFASEFRIEDGAVVGPDLKLSSRGKSLGLSGRTTFAGEMDYSLDLSALLEEHATGRQVKELLGDRPLAAKLGGSLTSPRLELPDLAEDVLGGLKSELLEGFGEDPKGTLDRLRNLFDDGKDGQKGGERAAEGGRNAGKKANRRTGKEGNDGDDGGP